MADDRPPAARLLRHLLGAPAVILPAMAGVAGLGWAWAADNLGGWLGFLGGAGLLLSAGVAASRWLARGADLVAAADREHHLERQTAYNAELEELYAHLQTDADPSDDELLERLRGVYQRLAALQQAPPQPADQVRPMLAQAEAMHRACVRALRQVRQQWDVAAQMTTPAAREAMLGRRRQTLDEVRRSTEDLAALVDQVLALNVEADPPGRLNAIRQQFQAGLDLAHQVQVRAIQGTAGSLLADLPQRGGVMDWVRRLFGAQTPAEQLTVLGERRSMLQAHRERLFASLESLEQAEAALLEQGRAADSPAVRRRLAAQLALHRKDLARLNSLAMLLGGQIEQLATHIHNLELNQLGQVADLPSLDDLRAGAERAESLLDELRARQDLAAAAAVPVDGLSSGEEEQILAEFARAQPEAAPARAARPAAAAPPAVPAAEPGPAPAEPRRERMEA